MAYPDEPTAKLISQTAMRSVLDVADATEYLKGQILLPVRDATKQPRLNRGSRKLGLVLPHPIGSQKRHVLPLYFHKLNMNKEGLPP